mgnify:CR=1 FL=1
MSVVPLQDVRKNAISRKDFVGEPILPIKCKPSDLTLQGSNGTLINLSNESESGSATINIVAGIAESLKRESIVNSEKYNEIVKPAQSAQLGVDDSSRLIVSQKFNSDDYYSLPGINANSIPTIALKTDAVRILAKNDLKIVVGTDQNQSTIIIKNDGNIVITPAKQIRLSGESDDQPYIRYDEFTKVISGLENSILYLQQSLTKLTAALDTVTSGAASAAIVDTQISVTDSLGDVQTAMTTVASQKILGS